MADGIAGRPKPRPGRLRRPARLPLHPAPAPPAPGARRSDAGRGGGAVVRPRRRPAAPVGGMADGDRSRRLRRRLRRDRLHRPGRADLRAAHDGRPSRARDRPRGGDRRRPPSRGRPLRPVRAAGPHPADRRGHRFARSAVLPLAGGAHALEAEVTLLLEARGLALAGRLHPADLAVGTPALVAIVGPNGSGKTSLLHALAGIGPSSGEVRIEGKDPSGLAPEARKRLLAYLPATRDVAWPVTARDLIALGGGRFEAVASMLDLEPLGDRRMDRLSTGERSRVLLARALAPRPRLLLLDEPAANLDPAWQLRLMEALRGCVADGRGVIAAFHDLDLAARYADRMLVMDGGRIVADGPPAEILGGEVVEQVFGIRRSGPGWALV